jgi:geranylgeranyl reductase family protein
MNEEIEILVVGAGPAGLIAAREAASRGAEVTVLEEDTEIGLPCHCTGLLSLRGLRNIGIPPDGQFVQNKVRGARFFSPSGLSFTIEKDRPVACVVDRCLFDRFLARQAIEAGAQIRLNSRAHGIKRVKTQIATNIGRELVRAKILIDAEGVSSRFVRAAGLNPLNPKCILPGLQIELEGAEVDPNYVEVHTGRRIAPKFFAWVIPLSEDSVRVGLACEGANTKERLENFVRIRFGDDNVFRRVSTRPGLVVTGGPIEKTFKDNFLVVGDAAGQVKSTTGGGVIFGGICASKAGEVVVEAVKKGTFVSSFLERYESLWKETLGKEFGTTLLARKVMNRLSDKAIDKIFAVIIQKKLQDLLSEEDDMDLQRGAILKLMKRIKLPGILSSFLSVLSSN